MIENDWQFTDLFLPREIWEKIRKPVISIFLLIHLGGFLLYLMVPNAVAVKLLEPFQKYFIFLTLFQGYGVFAPSPTTINLHFLALVSYEDGSIRVYPCPRLERTSLIGKLTHERFRKFFEDNLPNPVCTRVVDDVARYVARQCDVCPPSADGAANRPKVVTLLYYKSDIPPSHEHKPNPPHFQPKVLYVHQVEKDDLE